jgi:hypothetical protein
VVDHATPPSSSRSDPSSDPPSTDVCFTRTRQSRPDFTAATGEVKSKRVNFFRAGIWVAHAWFAATATRRGRQRVTNRP